MSSTKKFKKHLKTQSKVSPQQEITCSKCGQGLGLSGEYWVKFLKRYPFLSHSVCPREEEA